MIIIDQTEDFNFKIVIGWYWMNQQIRYIDVILLF